ncbi:hypothetical protein JTE90_018087 [Oedothorax gibbosus]|uniref:Gamma-interferon-inducible lysosomal thiol reductase n=1 Tax=Oedothorax gibbosus TaxID=931172 RepID=A0AAV6UHB3_9ARAC|nr:hypothetical protein JTE90_018087 [Oedothorax gibbosus]
MSVALVLGVLGFFSGVHSDTPVNLNVYYESMCPDSALFFREQLVNVQSKIPSYLNIELFPYGNAHYSGQHDEYTFTCQHGPNECYGNMVQTCYIELVNNTDSRIKFINCAFKERDQSKSLGKCIPDVDLRRQVKKCVTGPLGRNLEYEVAKKTESLNPRHSFIPWITVNGKGDASLNDKANENLMSVVCDEISDPKPDACLKNKWKIYRNFF